MRAVIQRVTYAKVEVAGTIRGEIGPGVLVLLGVSRTDTSEDAAFLASKAVHLRIFNDGAGKMNRSLLDTGGAMLAVSQFTLYGDCRKGRRPGFDDAAPANEARQLYEHFVDAVRRLGAPVQTGVFQTDMAVTLVNDGPVTLIVESPLKNTPSGNAG